MSVFFVSVMIKVGTNFLFGLSCCAMLPFKDQESPTCTEVDMRLCFHCGVQRWSDCVFLLSDPILFLKNDIRMRSESCFGWNHTTRFRKLSESVLWCTTYILHSVYFALWGKITAEVILPLAENEVVTW